CFAFAASLLFVLPAITHAKFLVLDDGRMIEVKSYEIRGNLVYISAMDEKTYVIRRNRIDFEATKSTNQAKEATGAADGAAFGKEAQTLADISREIRERRGLVLKKRQRDVPMDVFQEEIESLIGRDDIGIPQDVYESLLRVDTVYPKGDLYVGRVTNAATKNEEYLKVSSSIRNSFRALLELNLQPYVGTKVTKGLLNFHVEQQGASTDQPVTLKLGLITDIWSEKGLESWRECPTFVDLGIEYEVSKPDWYSIDVTKAIQAVTTRGVPTFYGFVLYTAENAKDDKGVKWINSRRHRNPELWPRLIVTYLNKEAEEKKTLHPTADLWIDQSQGSAQKSGDLRLSGALRHKAIAFVKFDLSQGKEMLINDARLSLYLFDKSFSKGTFNIHIGIPKRNWNYSTLTGWSKSPTLGQEGPSFRISAKEGWYEEDITNLVRWATYHGNNYGLMLYTNEKEYVRFHSSRTKNMELKPKLVINSQQQGLEKVVLAGETQERYEEGPMDRLFVLLANILENPNIVKALKISFIPGMILGLFTLRWIEKRFSFLIGFGIVVVSIVSVIIAERNG
ncbi:DNRLRE domain-containing protein, partial [Acidobacteriota bacterium]